jgi:hypothetical protein
MYLQFLMTVHVRWPGQTSGAFGLALIFFVTFCIKAKSKYYNGQAKEYLLLYRNILKLPFFSLS